MKGLRKLTSGFGQCRKINDDTFGLPPIMAYLNYLRVFGFSYVLLR